MFYKKLLATVALVAAVVMLAACAAPGESPPAISTAGETEKREPGPVLNNFATTDLEGNPVTQEIFAEYDLTMLNVWATYCGPCLEELPALGELAEEYQGKGVQILGLVLDAQNVEGTIDQEQVALVKEIVAETKADYIHLLPSPDLNEAVISKVTFIPETFFLDRDGNLVGKSYVGSRDKEKWDAVIQTHLAEVR